MPEVLEMRSVIIPKSTQLNADDLIGRSLTIRITGVSIKSGEQPVSISFEGDNGKPYYPCKSMARVLVFIWGDDANQYIGRSLTLYRDPSVTWAGLQVGGIRISHASNIDTVVTMALTATRGNRKPFTVKPLPRSVAPPPAADKASAVMPPTNPQAAEAHSDAVSAWDTNLAMAAENGMEALKASWREVPAEVKAVLKVALDRRHKPSAEAADKAPPPHDPQTGEVWEEHSVRPATSEDTAP